MMRQPISPVILLTLAGSCISNAAAQSDEAFPAVLALSSLDGTDGFVLNGIDPGDQSGVSVSSAGDVNGDGVDDLIIGAIYADPNFDTSAGESYVVFGGINVGSSGTINLSSLDGSNGFTLNGINSVDASGGSVSSAGDVNDDGVDDLIIGAFGSDPNGMPGAGESYVVFGGIGVGSSGTIELSSLDGTDGFVLNGIDAGDRSGESVSSAGDVNGDGVDDLIIGAINAAPNGLGLAGESYVVFGGAGVGSSGTIELSSLDGSTGFTLNGIGPGDRTGWSVSSAGDVNGDGIDDLLTGTRYANSNFGQSYVVFGGAGVGTSGSINYASLDGTDGYLINGVSSNDQAGYSVSSAGDINNDGVNDLIIGALAGDPNGLVNGGECFVVFGGAGVGTTGVIDLSTIDGTNGFVINGSATSEQLGFSVSCAGDVDGDDIDDLIVAGQSIGTNQRSYVVFGGEHVGSNGIIEVSSLDGSNGFGIDGIDFSDGSGRSVSSAGDINGDGVADLLIGALNADPNGMDAAGESYVVFGRSIPDIWGAPAGGAFENASNWISGLVPVGVRAVIIEPEFGGTITTPSTPLALSSLSLGAGSGQTRFELQPSSVVSISTVLTIPDNAALTGSGIISVDAGITNDGLLQSTDLIVLTAAGLTNNNQVDLTALSSASGSTNLAVFGPITNEVDGQILLRQGDVELNADSGIMNHGAMNITFANAAVNAQVNNEAGGLISVSGASNALINGNITNASSIVLTDDSALVVLGSIMGNGVSGPGGAGTAGSVYIEGGVLPGLPSNPFGVAEFDGDLNLGPASLTTIEIGGTTPGVDMDQITSHHFGANGTLELVLVDGYVPQPSDVYQVLDFVTVSGSFSSVVLDAGLAAAGADTTNLLIDGTITIPAECLADVNGDGIVSPTDFSAWINAFNNNAPECDQNGDGSCTPTDFTAWIANYNAGC
jgi:hypothetical protein